MPCEGLGDVLVVLLEAQQAGLDLGEGREVVGGEHLALHDREVDLDLVEPTGMDRTMHRHEGRIGGLQATDAGGAAVRGAVVHDPEDAAGVPIGRLGHDLGDESLEGRDPGRGLAAAEELGAVDIEGGQVGPGAATRVLVFDPRRPPGTGRDGGVPSEPRLDAGLLVGADHEVRGVEGCPLPLAGVQVENAPRLGRERGIARENPHPVLPGADGILGEPAPHGGAAHGGHEARPGGLAGKVGATQPGQGESPGGGQFTGEGFDLHDDLWGETPGAAPGGDAPPARVSVRRRSVCARD